jgi:hypothetical protein
MDGISWIVCQGSHDKMTTWLVRSSNSMATKLPDQIRGLQRVGRALTERHEEVVAEMVQRIREEVPAYTKVDPSVFERIRKLASPTALAISAGLINHTPVRRGDIPTIKEQAADRLEAGIDLDSFLHAYRAALFLYWDMAMEETTRLRLSRIAALAVGRYVLDSIDTITTHAAEAYLREDNRVRTQTGRAVADLIDRVLAGQPTVQHSPVAPGFNPSRPVQIVIARIINTSHDINTALTTALEILDETVAIGATAPLSTIRHQEIVALVPGSPPISRLHTAARCAREREQIHIGIGVSNSPSGFAGVPKAYAEAALTLSYTSSTRPVVALAELRAVQLLVLGAGDTTRQLISEKGRRLDLLPAKERDAAIETIHAFTASSMNISAAASALNIHPNTVRYRLDRIAQTTGLDPRTFPGLADLHCIIELAGRISRDAANRRESRASTLAPESRYHEIRGPTVGVPLPRSGALRGGASEAAGRGR